MATKVEELDTYTPANNRGRKPLYPWKKWFTSKPVRLRKGRDFKCTVVSMADLARRHIRKKGLAYTVYTESNAIVLKQKKEAKKKAS